MKIKITRAKKTLSEITIVQCGCEHYEIKYIRTALEHRGQGFASQLLEKAKAKFSPLVAFLDDDGTGLTVEQMERWYKRHGFKKRRFDFAMDCGRNIKTVMYWENKVAG